MTSQQDSSLSDNKEQLLEYKACRRCTVDNSAADSTFKVLRVYTLIFIM